MSRAREVARSSTHAIDKYHRGVMKEICESGQASNFCLILIESMGRETKDETSGPGAKVRGPARRARLNSAHSPL